MRQIMVEANRQSKNKERENVVKQPCLNIEFVWCEINFAYVSLALFRQLPAGNPGAYKLFANLLSLPKNQ